MTGRAKKRAACLVITGYLLGNGLVLGLLTVYVRSHNTMHREKLPAAQLIMSEDGYQLQVASYTVQLPAETGAVSRLYQKSLPFLPTSLRMAVLCYCTMQTEAQLP